MKKTTQKTTSKEQHRSFHSFKPTRTAVINSSVINGVSMEKLRFRQQKKKKVGIIGFSSTSTATPLRLRPSSTASSKANISSFSATNRREKGHLFFEQEKEKEGIRRNCREKDDRRRRMATGDDNFYHFVVPRSVVDRNTIPFRLRIITPNCTKSQSVECQSTMKRKQSKIESRSRVSYFQSIYTIWQKKNETINSLIARTHSEIVYIST